MKVAGGKLGETERTHRTGGCRARAPAGRQNRCSVRRIWHPAGMARRAMRPFSCSTENSGEPVSRSSLVSTRSGARIL